jgi:hypothetical protein
MPLYGCGYWEDRFFQATKGDYFLGGEVHGDYIYYHTEIETNKLSRIIKFKNILRGWGFEVL